MTPTQIKECGLKREIGRQAFLKRDAQETVGLMNNLFAQSLGAMVGLVSVEVTDKLVWEYVEINHLWWQGDSSKMGIFTSIKDYTNKAGKVSKAHYSDNDCYIRRAKAGDVPVSYLGRFEIKPETFQYVLTVTSDRKWVLSFAPKSLEEIAEARERARTGETPTAVEMTRAEAIPLAMASSLPTAVVTLMPLEEVEVTVDSEDETLADIQVRLRR